MGHALPSTCLMPCTTSEAQGCKAHAEHQQSKEFLLMLHFAGLKSCAAEDVTFYGTKRCHILLYQEMSHATHTKRCHMLQHACQCTARDVRDYNIHVRARSYHLSYCSQVTTCWKSCATNTHTQQCEQGNDDKHS